jgi:hypothetical protein
MPNINEFISPKPEKILGSEMEKILGDKPCSKCNLNAKEALWDAINMTLTWKCPDGHENIVRVG